LAGRDSDFSVLKAMATAAEECGARGTFRHSDLCATTLSDTISALSTKLT